MFPRVSVIISAYNAENTIEDLIKSLSKQTFSKEKTEIIIVNDCSDDRTLEILERLVKQDYQFVIFSHEENKGLSAARNTGIRNSSGRILIFLDSDMIVNEHYIENHVNYHNNRQVIGVMGGIIPKENLKIDKYQKYLYRSRRGARKFSPKASIPYNVFLFNNSSIKRIVLDECGMFDENIKVYGGEDTEFSFRISQKYPDGLFCSFMLIAIHNHYRSFQDSLKILKKFAKKNIPYIINKHPQMSKLYGLKYLSKEYDNSTVFHRIIGKIICLKIFYGLNYFFYILLPFPFSNIFVRSIMAHKLFRGIRRGLK